MSSSSKTNNDDNGNDNWRTTNTKIKVFRVPDNLESRLQRLYDWDEGFCTRAIEAYRTYMLIVAQFNDWDHSQLLPPPVIKNVWQQHILDVDHYVFACNEYTGHRIGHNPDAGIDEEEETDVGEAINKEKTSRADRIKATFNACRALKGIELDEEIWNYDDEEEEDKKDDKKKTPRKRRNESAARKQSSSTSSSNKRARRSTGIRCSEPLTIRVGSYMGRENYSDVYFKIKPDTKMVRGEKGWGIAKLYMMKNLTSKCLTLLILYCTPFHKTKHPYNSF